MFVRLALESDVETYVDLARQAVAESARHVGFSDERVRHTFTSYIKQANPTIFVVEDRRKLIGFLNATISGYTFADGHYTTQEVLFVVPEKRGTRAAALLLREFVQWSDRMGALENTGGNDNGLFTEQTSRLLSKFGFEHVGHFMRRIGSAGGGQERRQQ